MNRNIWVAICTLVLGAFGLTCSGDSLQAQAPRSQAVKVDTKGLTASILYEAVINGGHIPEVRGRFKLRITELVIAPGGYVGDHNHLGPGIRQMTEGEMEYIMPEKTVVYRSGDYFFETGDVSHRVLNNTDRPSKHVLFEILPVDVAGPSLIPPRNAGKH
jgi:quercetin dioxygenase-like cupin family protein